MGDARSAGWASCPRTAGARMEAAVHWGRQARALGVEVKPAAVAASIGSEPVISTKVELLDGAAPLASEYVVSVKVELLAAAAPIGSKLVTSVIIDGRHCNQDAP